MLQRSIRHSLHILSKSAPPTPCRVCTCRCGALVNIDTSLPRPPTPSTQRRSYATHRKSPATRDKENARQWERQRVGERAAEKAERVARNHRLIHMVHTWGDLNIDPDSACEFFDKVDRLLDTAQGRPTADPVAFKKLMDEYGINLVSCEVIAHQVIDLAGTPARERVAAKKYILTLSRIGSVWATLRLLATVIGQHKTPSSSLKSTELQYARAHLTQLAKDAQLAVAKGDSWVNYRAMVLEGKVALALGDEDRAILLWTQAIDAAVKEAARQTARSGYSTDNLELSSPWIDLTELHMKRSNPPQNKNEMDQAIWAMNIGCEQDDPLSHWHTAIFKKELYADGTLRPTADWLYHLTKAATSNYQKAIHELACYYAESGWKYIEDEPPDHLKPTPFDSYPVRRLSRKIQTIVREFVGLQLPNDISPRDSIFISATFPSTAKERYELAIQWLKVNEDYLYAPSFLFHAKMLTQETLWARADAPKSALNLSNDRYTYASEEDAKANNPIEKPNQPEPQDPPNPFYDPQGLEAKKLIREIFFAYEAHVYVARERKKNLDKRRLGNADLVVEDENVLLSERLAQSEGANVSKWLRYSEVREMYEHEIEELYRQAKEMCDQHGWDMMDDDGGLLYRAKVTQRSTKG